MRAYIVPIAVSALLAAACQGGSGDGEVTAEVAAAADAITHTIEAAQPVRVGFELLGALPEFAPGTSRADYVAQCSEALHQHLGCAAQTIDSRASSDRITLTFPGDGCLVGRHGLAGTMAFEITGGGDCVDAQVDLTETVLDSFVVGSKASRGICRGASAWSAVADGALEHGYTYSIEGRLLTFDGANPFSDRATLVVDGHCTLSTPDGEYAIRIDQLTYTRGDLSPHRGEVHLTHPEHRIHATLVRKTGEPFDLTEATILVDEKDPVVVPLP